MWAGDPLLTLQASPLTPAAIGSLAAMVQNRHSFPVFS